jgi:signal transduction histidine kinase
VRFDDRLLTVLNQPAEDRHDAAVRWRQLVDLVARAGSDSASPVVADALQAIRSDAGRIEEATRAAAARAVAALPLPLGLLEYFASDSLTVSAPVLAAATLDPRQWGVIRAAADGETQRFIDTLHPELTAEPPPVATAPVLSGEIIFQRPAPPPSPYAPPSLHEVVERIERRRRLRAEQAGPIRAQPGVPQEPPSLFRWECGPGGEIAWVEGAPRGALIGRAIAKSQDQTQVDQEAVRAFAVRAPFRDASMKVSGSGALAGEWKISGVPAFEPADGRFAGYRGVALREAEMPWPEAATESMPEVLSDPDSLRELVHEIKTPLNAIIGFAEMIEGQFLGPADRGYRDRAAEIVGQARLLLSAIDDLDFAAKVHSARGSVRERVDVGALLGRAEPELKAIAARYGAQAEVRLPRDRIAAAVEPELADRLLIRLFATLADWAHRGEQLQVSAELTSDGARIEVSRPSAMGGLSDTELFDPTMGRDGTQGGFSLRLARGLAHIAGGGLVASRDALALVFPPG